MTGYTIPLAFARQRRSPLVRNRRDLVATAGDDFALALTIYESESAAGPANITGAAAQLSIMEDDGGYVVGTADGVIVSASGGRMNIPVPASLTAELRGRYRLIIQLDFDSGVSAQVHGAINIEPGATGLSAGSGEAPDVGLVFVSISDAVLTDDTGSVLVTVSIGDAVLTDGAPGDGPIVLLDKDSMAFGSVTPDTFSGVISVKITNDGNAPLIITGITVSGDFEITGLSVP